MSASTNLDLGVHRIASQEAVSVETRLALIALRRGQVQNSIMDRLAHAANTDPPASTAIAVDKTA
ncbi:hypothetical protein [Devosia nitrariae]|uniref:ANTAR domain-containing protein n=1 Tax=Devosia nitrariae TaxID=2071872 RepID=A0ABQ5W2E1_9HYPH|nr:hypothetical protein [Devosia nitrariae]GLQ54193.1 hypothetical protein GCM10010862_14520 [Devosia nitrariae]